LVTGCSEGLGKAILDKSNKNINIYPHFRSYNNLYPQALVGDINDKNFYDNLEKYLSLFKIDTFINNAAIYSNKNINDISDQEIVNIINTNVTSQILMTKRVMKHFLKNDKGLIININSLAGMYPSKNESVYSASKFAIKAFSKSLQLECLDNKIEFVDFFIGAMKTRMSKDRKDYDLLMDVEDISEKIINVVLSDDSSNINEIVIRRKKI